jgi:tellurite resistance protein TerA
MGIDYNKRPGQPAQPPAQPPAAPPPPLQPPGWENTPMVPPQLAGQPQFAQAGQPGQPAPPVSLSKVTLTKAAPAISLAKSAGASGLMRVNLNWQQGGKRGLFKSKSAGAVDLDLRCLFEMQDGYKGGVDALGKQFGSLDGPPYILLDGDDRSGFSEGGENLTINLDRLDQIKRVLIYTAIYSGVINWADARAVVTLYPVGAPPIEVFLDEATGQSPACGIALLTNQNGALTVSREVVYVGNAEHLDQRYGWGLSWSQKTKD